VPRICAGVTGVTGLSGDGIASGRDRAVGSVIDPGMYIDALPMRLGTHRLGKQCVCGNLPARLDPAPQIDKKICETARLGIYCQRVAL
jgi:hypothetical protein